MWLPLNFNTLLLKSIQQSTFIDAAVFIKYVPLGKHSRHYTDNNKHLRVFRTSKHRYIYFTAKSRKKLLKKLNYKIENTYPKIQYSRYQLGSIQKRKIINTITNEVYWE